LPSLFKAPKQDALSVILETGIHGNCLNKRYSLLLRVTKGINVVVFLFFILYRWFVSPEIYRRIHKLASLVCQKCEAASAPIVPWMWTCHQLKEFA